MKGKRGMNKQKDPAALSLGGNCSQGCASARFETESKRG
jgi:hypothetical protein